MKYECNDEAAKVFPLMTIFALETKAGNSQNVCKINNQAASPNKTRLVESI